MATYFAQRTQFMCWVREKRNFCRWTAQTLTVLSSEAVTRDWPSLEKLTLRTVPVCALNTVDSPFLKGRKYRERNRDENIAFYVKKNIAIQAIKSATYKMYLHVYFYLEENIVSNCIKVCEYIHKTETLFRMNNTMTVSGMNFSNR